MNILLDTNILTRAAQPSHSIGKDKKTPITLFKDDEYADRFFLVVGQTDRPMVRFVIAGMDAVKIAEALRQVQEDLEDEE